MTARILEGSAAARFEAAQEIVRVGGDDSLQKYVPRVPVGKDGRYVLPFMWESVDYQKLAMGYGTASVLGLSFGIGFDHRAKNQRGRVYLCLDIKKLIAVGYSPVPGSAPQAASIAKDFYVSYRKLLPILSYRTSPLLSVELLGLIGRIDIHM